MSRMGLEIARLRKEIGMTQKQLAKLVGVTEGFIGEVEAGRKVLKSDLSTKISKALSHEVDKLDLYDVEEKVYRPEPDKNVVKVIEKPVQDVWNEALSGE
jgi:transcriptional regulator with XRE-family HTH domain